MQIAREEARHAALARRVHSWARARLDREARARVDAAVADAHEALYAELAAEPPAALVREAGLPDACTARRLAALLQETLTPA
jgi:hypothetical protein